MAAAASGAQSTKHPQPCLPPVLKNFARVLRFFQAHKADGEMSVHRQTLLAFPAVVRRSVYGCIRAGYVGRMSPSVGF